MIELRELTKNYGSEKILQGVNLKCQKGEIQAILGANGSGKTTLINIISGLISSDSGTVLIDEKEITPERSNDYKANIGYVFEKPTYIEKLTATEYLTIIATLHKLPKDRMNHQVTKWLDFFELPKGKKYIENYSKGMKNKTSLAAALIHEPMYLILDEPFDGIDFSSIQKISRLLKELAGNGVTILITSHQFDIIASLCDNFSLLKKGKIDFNLTMDELHEKTKTTSNSSESIKAYLETQILSE